MPGQENRTDTLMASRLVLLLDDAPETAFIVRRIAAGLGHRVTAHPCFESAWKWLEELPAQGAMPDLVLFDWHLPGPSGLEFLMRLKHHPRWRSIPAALLGDWQRGDEIVEALKAGADAVVEKDLLGRPHECAQRFQELLEAASSNLYNNIVSYHDGIENPGRSGGAEAFNRALDHLEAARRNGGWLSIFWERALEDVNAARPELRAMTRPPFLRADRCGLAAEALPAHLAGPFVKEILSALSRRLRLGLGARFAAKLEEAFSN